MYVAILAKGGQSSIGEREIVAVLDLPKQQAGPAKCSHQVYILIEEVRQRDYDML